MHKPLEPLAYRISDACRVSGIGRSRMYELIAAGEITARKSGRSTLVDAQSLHEYLKGLKPAVLYSYKRRPQS